MTYSDNNSISDRNDFLADIANEVDAALVNNPQLKPPMIKHIEKVIQKTEEYGQYLRAEWQKAKNEGLTSHDKNKEKGEWFWWTSYTNDWGLGESVYFADDEMLGVQFYIKGEPKPDPLGYLRSMICGSVGQIYEGLELLDYQLVLLAIIHDAQSWQAGRERIYFNTLKENTLSDRLCRAVWSHLEENVDLYNYRDVRLTIKTALKIIKASVEKEAKKEVGDSHSIKAGGDISAGGDIIFGNKNIKKQDIPAKKKEMWYQTNTFKFVVIPLLGILVMGAPAWILLFKTTDQNLIQAADIFAYISKDGDILQSKNFPWTISKSKDNEGNVIYIIEGRYGDSSAASVFPDNSRNEYIVYNAIGGVAVKFTCPEEEISNFTINLKH